MTDKDRQLFKVLQKVAKGLGYRIKKIGPFYILFEVGNVDEEKPGWEFCKNLVTLEECVRTHYNDVRTRLLEGVEGWTEQPQSTKES